MEWRRLIGAGLVGAGLASCNAVFGIEEGEPRDAIGDTFCEGKPEGTPLAEQTIGDCAKSVCDGYGKSKVVQDAQDLDDQNPCTDDQCNGFEPVHTVLPQIACYTGPAGTEGTGACKGGFRQCSPEGPIGGCEGQVLPTDEKCATVLIDDDCDGLVEEGGDDCTCGDNIHSPENGEDCDDGGTSDADACSSICTDQRIHGLSAGFAVTCARLTRGLLKCWGQNFNGANGLGELGSRGDSLSNMGSKLPFVFLGAGKRVADVASSEHSCALLEGGEVKCWGKNQYGRLGLGDVIDRGTDPAQMGDNLPALKFGADRTAKAITVGYAHSCAILDDDTLKCWGYNSEGQLGIGIPATIGDDPGEMGDALSVVKLGAGRTVKAVAAGYAHTCAILDDGHVKCWGANAYGQLGLEDTVPRGGALGQMGDDLPAVSLGNDVKADAIAAGAYHTCVALSDGTMKCWGRNDVGQLGLGDTVNRGDTIKQMGANLPAIQTGPFPLTGVAANGAHTCAHLLGTVKCWGLNGHGELGLGDVQNRGDGPNEMGDNLPYVFLGIGAGPAPIAVAPGDEHTCAILADGSVKCWGGNKFVQLGLGDTSSRGDAPNEMGESLPRVKLYNDNW